MPHGFPMGRGMLPGMFRIMRRDREGNNVPAGNIRINMPAVFRRPQTSSTTNEDLSRCFTLTSVDTNSPLEPFSLVCKSSTRECDRCRTVTKDDNAVFCSICANKLSDVILKSSCGSPFFWKYSHEIKLSLPASPAATEISHVSLYECNNEIFLIKKNQTFELMIFSLTGDLYCTVREQNFPPFEITPYCNEDTGIILIYFKGWGLKEIEIKTGHVVREIRSNSNGTPFHSNRRLFLRDVLRGTVQIYDKETLEEIATVNVPQFIAFYGPYTNGFIYFVGNNNSILYRIPETTDLSSIDWNNIPFEPITQFQLGEKFVIIPSDNGMDDLIAAYSHNYIKRVSANNDNNNIWVYNITSNRPSPSEVYPQLRAVSKNTFLIHSHLFSYHLSSGNFSHTPLNLSGFIRSTDNTQIRSVTRVGDILVITFDKSMYLFRSGLFFEYFFQLTIY